MFTHTKNNFIAVFSLFVKTLKNNFAWSLGIIAVYAAAGWVIFEAFIAQGYTLLGGLLFIPTLLSFISSSAPLFAGKKLRLLNIFPNWKLIGYSVIVGCFTFMFLLPVRFFTKMLFSLTLPMFTGVNMDQFAVVLLIFMVILVEFFILFAILDFNGRPKIDQPVINSADILISNKLLISIFAAIGTVLVLFVPGLAAFESFSPMIYALICLFITAVYYVLKPEDEEAHSEKNAVQTQTDEAKLPKIKISL